MGARTHGYSYFLYIYTRAVHATTGTAILLRVPGVAGITTRGTNVPVLDTCITYNQVPLYVQTVRDYQVPQ